MRNFYFMNLNLKMTVERSKRRSYFLSLIFITKCFSKNLLLRKIRLFVKYICEWVGACVCVFVCVS